MLLMTGRPGLELINGWIAGLSNIALNLWLIPRYGAFGAALATAMSVAMLNLIRLLQVYRIHRCYPFRTSTFKVLAAFAISAGAMWLLAHLYHFALGGKLACMAGFLAIYAGLLFAFGRDEEDQFVIDRLKRRFGQLRG
jgi:O-antigen/teichoic acid export membrane protein